MKISYAALALEMALALCAADRPAPPKPDGGCDHQCVNGYIIHGDGHKTPCPCPPDCKCRKRAGATNCETGSCQQPKPLPAPAKTTR